MAGSTDAKHYDSSASLRTGKAVKWYRRISVKLAFALGLAMFSIQLLASRLIIESYQASLESELTQTPQTAAIPFAEYLSDHLERQVQNDWMPTAEAIEVIENFLAPGDTYVWLDAKDRVLLAGEAASIYVEIGDKWDLCRSNEDCQITLGSGEDATVAVTSEAKLARNNRHIGTFVLVWMKPPLASAISQQQLSTDITYRLLASGMVAAAASLLLVSLVTRRLSRLAVDASEPLDEKLKTVDLPGPFLVSGDDEIARLAAALNTMRERIKALVIRLEERDRQRREWIAQVSHDLRTPLTALSVCLDRAKEKLVETEDPNERSGVMEAITVAHQDGRRLQLLVDDLFELARLDARDDLVLEPVPPGELVRHAVRGLKPMAEAQGIALKANVEPSLPLIRADGRRLMRALENLLRNAIQYGESKAELIATYREGDLIFEVQDDGPGLPEKDGMIVLEDSTKKPRKPDSAGLGLIVTARVATAHGGSLGGRNLPGGGAAVWISIPVLTPIDDQADS